MSTKPNSKRTSIRILLLTFLVLLVALAFFACRKTQPSGEGTDAQESATLPQEIETVTEAVTQRDTEPDTEPPEEVTEPGYQAQVYTPAATPDYVNYITATRISQVLSGCDALVIAKGSDGMKLYRNTELKEAGSDLVVSSDIGLTVDIATVAALYGVETDKTGYVLPVEAASLVGRHVLVYDRKLVMFYTGSDVLDVYDDMYTLEAMYLYLTGADETEILNAFIDLPDLVSNGTCNAVFYTAPDLNLGIQSSVYYTQMGATPGVDVGPRLVAGEGKYMGDGKKNLANHTVVRVFNEQQALTAQFLAFDISVEGGVQVAAAAVGGETLIATAPFVAYDGPDGDVRIFDVFGTLRMDITLRNVMTGPYTIVTGHFVAGKADEVLLVTAQALDADGRLPYALIDLSDGSVITMSTLDCAFGLSDAEGATREVQLSVRHATDGTTDSLILYFPAVQAVYEGNPQQASFKNAGITVPEIATGVYASSNVGEKYIITVGETEEEENRSFLVVYDYDGNNGGLLDVGFRENVFYTARYWNDNDDTYVSTGSFMHIRCDLSNGVMGQLNSASTVEAIDNVFDNACYADYAFGGLSGYIDRYRQNHLFLEPCFTHRWNKISGTTNLKNYEDPDTGEKTYVSIGKSGEYSDYLELGSSFYIGTYADGILDLAKLRLYPLRSFLQAMAVEFRGENGNPEHLVGMSPVHEHEIDVAGTVGDYNVYMIRGFQIYMMEQYGSVQNINQLFGTDFSDEYEIDPPREMDRGEWDAYKGDYFEQWVLYNRYIVSKRIMEAYREALLAGYPPESISAHQIPEGDAVAGFLGEANTRISPIDVVTTCGTAYGGTRYGTFYSSNQNFIGFANTAGQWNISIGEYCALQDSATGAFAQLKYLWEHGVRMIHQITFTDTQSAAEQGAIEMLAEMNQPRPGYTGGTTGSVSVLQNGKNYTIVQMGEGADSKDQGLLKSVTADGKWEGTVYLVPFHAYVNVTALEALQQPMEGTTNTWSTGTLGNFLKNSDIVELTMKASYSGQGRAYVRFSLYNQGIEMAASVVEYELTDTLTPYRYVVSNQLYMTDAEVRMTIYTEDGDKADIQITDLKGTLQQDAVGIKYFEGIRGYLNARSHRGGVTFDLIDRDMCG